MRSKGATVVFAHIPATPVERKKRRMNEKSIYYLLQEKVRLV